MSSLLASPSVFRWMIAILWWLFGDNAATMVSSLAPDQQQLDDRAVAPEANSNGANFQRQNCHQMLTVAYRFKMAIQVANCRKRGFDKVPHYLDSNTKMLDLKSNHIKRLVEESFQNYPHLVLLHLDRNEIKEITPKAFLPLRNLEVSAQSVSFYFYCFCLRLTIL